MTTKEEDRTLIIFSIITIIFVIMIATNFMTMISGNRWHKDCSKDSNPASCCIELNE